MGSFMDYTVGQMVREAWENDSNHGSYLMRGAENEPVLLATVTIGDRSELFRALMDLAGDSSEEAVYEAMQLLRDSIEAEKI